MKNCRLWFLTSIALIISYVATAQVVVLPLQGGGFGYIPAPISPVYTASVLETSDGTTQSGPPGYSNDRIASGPWTAIFHINDTTHANSNSIQGTANFPSGSLFSTTYPSDGNTGVRSFVFMDYGNYLDNTALISPSTINNLTAANVTFKFTYPTQTNAGNLTLDQFVFTSSAGSTATISKEIQVYLDPAPTTVTGFLNGLAVVGTYTSAPIGSTPAINWKVTYQPSNSQGVPYYQFRPVDTNGNTAPIHAGTFDLLAAMNYLKAQGKLTGGEWFTGFGVGDEALNSTGTGRAEHWRRSLPGCGGLRRYLRERYGSLIPVLAQNILNGVLFSGWLGFWQLRASPKGDYTSPRHGNTKHGRFTKARRESRQRYRMLIAIARGEETRKTLKVRAAPGWRLYPHVRQTSELPTQE